MTIELRAEQWKDHMCPLFRNLLVGDVYSRMEEIASCACINDHDKLLRYVNIRYCLYYSQ